MMNNEFCLEERIVILCSRIHLSNEQYDELKEMLLAGPDWGEVFKIAVFNKTMGLVSKHILHFNTTVVPGLIRRELLFMNLGNRERNKEMFKELVKVLELLNKSGIKYSPLKGAYLIPYVYQDYSVRLSNDIDILIRHDEVEAACKVMNDAGYIMGKYDDPTRTIVPARRAEDIYWKAQMGNIYPFVKISENPFLDFLVIDFAFDVDPVHKNLKIAEDMLNNVVQTEIDGTPVKIICPVDFLIQVCTHLYKEACARHAVKETYSDINLIKFCDVRELVLAQWDINDKEAMKLLSERAKQHNVENALVYSFECCRLIYEDNFWTQLIALLDKKEENNASPIKADDELFWTALFRRQG